ncbi:MAG: hypothetical protein GYB67_03900 [Chloroflexi bacterium]|nr:hypothetical protein [Chloroflexota bacterium]
MVNSLVGTVALISLVVHGLLLLLAVIRRRSVRAGVAWLLLTLLLSGLAVVSHFIRADSASETGGITVGVLNIFALGGVVITLGAQVLTDVRNRTPRLWLGLGSLWLLLLLIVGLTDGRAQIGQPDWLNTLFTAADPLSLLADPFSLITLLGLAAASLLLLGIAFYAFYAATLPEVANRALFWALISAIILMGVALMISGTAPLVLLGTLLLSFGALGMTYGQISNRVFDLRRELGLALRTFLLLIITALLIIAAITVATNLDLSLGTVEGTLSIVALALIVAAVYVPARQLTEFVLNALLTRSLTKPTEATRRYSRQISAAVELDALVETVNRTLQAALRVRGSALLTVSSSTDHRIDLQLMTYGGDSRVLRGTLNKAGLLYKRLALEQMPLSQFELEYNPDYREVAADERDFFRRLGMSAHAPIIAEDTLIGLLSSGAKLNDAPFYPRDLELLATMASQTGPALRNARLVTDLRRLNESMNALNANIEEARVQMEKLDSVKTDFITIASHELRTPLAQIRGYTDIIDALNDQGMLERDQTASMVASVRKASERMEELITAMLDVSQLDVDAMDLRFTQTALDSVMRLAIEPLTEAIKQRKLTLSARGLRGLPLIQGDMQRLVQAFRNLVVNAIKFTPDGGRIEITASLQKTPPNNEDHILIAITDTGVGIDRANLELIFRKFYRAYDPSLHSTGSYKFMGAGPGLGLTIARGVIEGHGGHVWAESNGHDMENLPGATFYVLLPLQPPKDAKRVMPFQETSDGVPQALITES